jgi:hypothetical protein
VSLAAFRDQLVPSYPYRVWAGRVEAIAGNPGEATKLESYIEAVVAGRAAIAPKLTTRFGKAQLLAVSALAPKAEPVPAPAPAPPPVPAPASMFDTAGLIVANHVSAFPPDTKGAALFAAGVRRCSFPIYSPDSANDAVAEGLTAVGWRTKMRSLGYVLGGFVDVDLEEPFESVREKVEARVRSLGLAYVDVDTEALKDDQRGDRGSWSLVAAFQGFPVPVRNVTFGYAEGANVFCQPSPSGTPIIDFTPYRNAGWHYSVESYEGAGNYVDPVVVVEKALTCGWKATDVEPLVEAKDRPGLAFQRVAEAQRRFGIVGFDVWDAANLEAGVADLEAAVAAGAAAI